MSDANNRFSGLDELLKAIKPKMNSGYRNSQHSKCQNANDDDSYYLDETEEEDIKLVGNVEKATSMDLPMDWDNIFDDDPRTKGVHVDNVFDGLVMSLNTLGRVDIEYISSITGEDYKTVISALRGKIYQNPETWDECFYKGWETSDEYLSGNVLRKYKIANKANEAYQGYFDANVNALKTILPKRLEANEIYVSLGSPWLPTRVIDDFIEFMFGKVKTNPYGSGPRQEDLKTRHDELTGTWFIPLKNRYTSYGVTALIDGISARIPSSYDATAYFLVESEYGTRRMNALDIIEHTLNMKTVSIYDEKKVYDPEKGKSKIVKVLNKAETLKAIEKQKMIVKQFKDWIWTDVTRKKALEEIYANKYTCFRERHFDGSILTLPDLNKNVELRPYQKDAVDRIIFTPNTLLAHDVGAGKTYIMIAAGHELIRMEQSKKNLYVVPNNITNQWEKIYKEMYPNANILLVSPKTFAPNKRQNVLEDIKNGQYEAVIMAYSCFDLIPLSREYYVNHLKEQIKEIEMYVAKQQIKHGSNIKFASLSRRIEKLKNKLNKVETSLEDENGIYFDSLRFTRMFVDEAHNFKNLPLETKIDCALGINAEGSKKCEAMLNKVQFIQRQNEGKGVVMASGTPITNSITDIFVMQKYLQPATLSFLKLQSFDSWVGNYAERVTQFEISVDANSYRLATRFSKFNNLPELSSLLAQIADFHHISNEKDLPLFNGYADEVLEKSDELKKYLVEISERAENIRSKSVSAKKDNMLKITTDGRKAALDIRLVMPDAPFSNESKVAKCAKNVLDVYQKTADEKSTQLVFCDTSTPKDEFNIYSELKRLLIEGGIKEEEIAFIHDATSDSKRDALFKKVNKGEIRIVLGSTFKLGLGVNIQERLIAVHHLDVPWRPADMVQREGRILRQGNKNKEIYIYRYITKGSFDAYSWQLLETKQRFISELLSGSVTERSGSDVDDTVLNYAEVKALAVGNPLIKKRVETANELSRLSILQRKLVEARDELKGELASIPSYINYQETCINNCKKDITSLDEYEKNGNKLSKEERKQIRESIANGITEHTLEIKEKKICTYKGFDIILPSNMMEDKPYVWLKKDGKYRVELSTSETGNLTRIDNYLSSLNKVLNEHIEAVKRLNDRKAVIEKELLKQNSYSDDIEKCKNELKDIDKEIGVK